MIGNYNIMSEENRKKLLDLDTRWAKMKMSGYEKKKKEIDLSKYFDEFMANVEENNHKPIHIDITDSDYEKPSDEEIDALIKEFKNFKCILSKYYIESLESMKVNCDLAPVKHEPVSEAIKILKDGKWVKKNKNRKKISIEEVYDKCVLAAKLLPNWNVVFCKSAVARMAIKGTTIRIMKSATFYEDEIDGLITHEIYTHAYRKYRGMRTGLWLFVLGMRGNNTANEGLAIYNQLQQHPSPYKNTLKIIALKRLISNKLAKIKREKKGDIYDVYNEIHKDFPDIPRDVIYNAIMRAKRCCTSTDSYRYVDSSVYYDGYMQVKNMTAKSRTILAEYPVSIHLAKSAEIEEVMQFLNVNLFPTINKQNP